MSSTPDPADAFESAPAADGDAGAPDDRSVTTDAASDAVDGELEEAAAEAVEPIEPDPQLLAAHDLALAALREITPEATIGDPADYRVEADGVVSLRFANRLAGYPGWFWTVSLARVDDAEPTVLEVELLPGDGALLAPDWVPWAVRLADYHAAQAALAEAAHADDEDDEDDEDEDSEVVDLDDVDDLDASDFDDDGSRILHAGDVDGVDIDELADASADELADASADDDDHAADLEDDEDDDDFDEDEDDDHGDDDEFDEDDTDES